MRIHNIKLGNQILSLLMAFVMVISMLPMSSFTAFAADATDTDTTADTTYPYAVVDTTAGTVTIDGTLGGKDTVEESDITALRDAIKGYVDNGITTIIVTGEEPAMINVPAEAGYEAFTNTAIGEAIYRLSDSAVYDEEYPYNGKIDLILQDVTEIVKWEFSFAYALNSITLPKVTKLGKEAFSGCCHLQTITFGSVVEQGIENGDTVFDGVGRETENGKCDLVLNCGQTKAATEYQPNLDSRLWWGREWKNITVKHTPAENATYTDNGDGTHSFECSVCGATVTEDHIGNPVAVDEFYHKYEGCCGAVDHTGMESDGICDICGFEQYNVWVDAIRITSLNMNDVLNDGGSLKYAPDTYTLTVSGNVTVSDSFNDGINNYVIYSKGSIIITGDENSSLTVVSEITDYGVYVDNPDGKLEVTGGMTLNATGSNAGIRASVVEVKNASVINASSITAAAKVVSADTTTYYATLSAALEAGGSVYALTDYSEDFTIPDTVTFYGGEYSFGGAVTNNGTIESGTFNGTVTNNNKINGGTFNGSVTNSADGKIYNNVSADAFTLGDNFSITNNGTIECTYHHWKDSKCRLCASECDHSDSQHESATDKGDGTHSFTCTVCGEAITEAHSGEDDGDCTTAVTCTICGTTITEAQTHSYTNGFCTNTLSDGTVCDDYQPCEGSGTEADPYKIGNAGQLYWFAEQVNGGKNTINAVLTEDIKVYEGTVSYNTTDARPWTPIGNDTTQYTGTFDGDGHTISGLFANYNGSGNYVGLIGYLGAGGTVKRLSVTNSILTGGNKNYGLIAGYNAGTIENCSTAGSVSGNMNMSGLAGYNEGRIVNCYTTASVSGGTNLGYLAGVNYGTVMNSYCSGPTSEYDRTGPFGYQNGTVDDQSGIMTADRFASGEVAYLLQGEQTEHVWGQTIGTDSYPTLGGAKVYAGYDTCANDAAVVYTNTETPAEKVHTYVNGICEAVEGEIHYEPAKQNESGIYEIGNAGQLMWFAELVNGGEKTANAILIDNIDMTGIDWTPICSTGLYYGSSYASGYGDADTGYAGIFDGNYHVIKNLSVTAIANETWTYGLFGTMTGTVKNLGIEGFTYNHNGATDMRTGAIVGQNLGGTIENCYVVKATITPGTNVAGGITGCNYAGTIKNCYVADSNIVASSARYGYIAGDNRADTAGDRVGTIENCYTDGDLLVGSYTGTETNSKYGVNYNYFTNGGVVWYLNGQSADGIWKQGETHPNFTGTAVTQSLLSTYTQPEIKDGVYQIKTESELRWFAEYVNFTDASVSAVLANDIAMTGDNWIPIGMYGTPFTGTFNGQGYGITGFAMTITEGGDWGLFGFVNNAKIQNFSISGTAVSELTEAPAEFNYGVIGEAAGSTVVTDVHSSVNFTSKDSYYKNTVAGILGRNNSTGADFAIERCSFSGVLDLGSAQVDCTGGILAYVMAGHTAKINNCLFSGKIISTYDGALQIGGMIGYYRMYALTITNCLSIGTITSTDSTLNGMIAGVLRQHTSANTKVTNNYYTEGTQPFGNSSESDDITDSYGSRTVAGSATAATTEQLKSGEIAYLLQQGNTEQVWGQDNNQAGATPILDSTGLYKVVTVAETGNYSVANVGDVNGDGTVDVTDYQALVNMAISDGHSQSETAGYDDIVKYDLNGDGYIDVLDASLMSLFINGFKTISVYAVGDYDLNGVAFEEADLKAINHAIENPETLATYKKYASDINGDGKADTTDVTLLTNIYGEITGTECADNLKISYRWSTDYSACTATAMCTLCGKIVATETVKTTSETITESTCIQDGEVKYTATFENELLDEKTKTVTTNMLSHDLGEWTDNGDGTHIRGCKNCDYTESDKYTSATPAKSSDSSQGNYYGFALSPGNTNYMNTSVPANKTLQLDSLTLQTRTGSNSFGDMKIAVYEYTGGETTGTYLGVSSSVSYASNATLTFAFDGITVNSSSTYQFLFVDADTTADLSTFTGYQSAAMAWGISLTNSFASNIPSGWGTYKGNGINSWEGMYIPVTTITMSMV